MSQANRRVSDCKPRTDSAKCSRAKEGLNNSENIINIRFVTVPLVKVREHLRLRGRFRRPENNVCRLSHPNFFQ